MRFTVYGPKEVESYWKECELLIESLPSSVVVDYVGPIPQNKVHDHLMQHDVFLFPTRGENYGHVVFEALSAGLFVIISDQTPWQDLEQHEIGVALPLSDKKRYAEVLQSASRWSHATWTRIRRNARIYAEKIALDDDAAIANRRLFSEKHNI